MQKFLSKAHALNCHSFNDDLKLVMCEFICKLSCSLTQLNQDPLVRFHFRLASLDVLSIQCSVTRAMVAKRVRQHVWHQDKLRELVKEFICSQIPFAIEAKTLVVILEQRPRSSRRNSSSQRLDSQTSAHLTCATKNSVCTCSGITAHDRACHNVYSHSPPAGTARESVRGGERATATKSATVMALTAARILLGAAAVVAAPAACCSDA